MIFLKYGKAKLYINNLYYIIFDIDYINLSLKEQSLKENFKSYKYLLIKLKINTNYYEKIIKRTANNDGKTLSILFRIIGYLNLNIRDVFRKEKMNEELKLINEELKKQFNEKNKRRKYGK